MGVATGLDFDELIALRGRVARWLEGEPLHGTIWRAGLPKTMLEPHDQPPDAPHAADADATPPRRSRWPACASSSSPTW